MESVKQEDASVCSGAESSAKDKDNIQEEEEQGTNDAELGSKEQEGSGSCSSANNDNADDLLFEQLARHIQAKLGITILEKKKFDPVIEEFNINGIAKYIQSEKCKNIIVMTGAGISTSAGIPDFRSPGTGLYDNLAKYNLPSPQSIFEIGYFRENPDPFFMLAKELFPGNYKPTPGHYFIRLLEMKKLLLRNYTQNIDGLELVAGVLPDHVIAAHGSFHTAHCLDCAKEYSEEWEKEQIFKGGIPRCEECEGIVKPDIVFFGEALPHRFFSHVTSDFATCDLLIVMGTSLVVQPFASLISRVPDNTPRLLINKEKCGEGGLFGGFDFDGERKYRDVAHLTTCDDGCMELADTLGWKDELTKLIEEGTSSFEAKLKMPVAANEVEKPNSSLEAAERKVQDSESPKGQLSRI